MKIFILFSLISLFFLGAAAGILTLKLISALKIIKDNKKNKEGYASPNTDDLDLSSDEEETDSSLEKEYGIDDKPVSVNEIIRHAGYNVKNYARLISNGLSGFVEEKSGVKEYTWAQKAAIFCIVIGSDISSKIFSFLRNDEIDTVSFEITRVDCVSETDKTRVLQEFFGLVETCGKTLSGGVEYAKELLEKAVGKETAADTLNRLNSSLQIKPFDLIRRTANPNHLVNLLKQEHPQITALVLSYLEPNKASVVLENLPHDMRCDVARRIMEMGVVRPETVREIERVLEKRLSSTEYNSVVLGGVESLVEILNLTNRETEKIIIEELEETAPDLAEQIKERTLVFEDIVMLDDRSIQKIMREVDSQELCKALKSVDSEVQEKFFENMSKRASAMLKEDMEYMGPVRLKDVEEAQQKIICIMRHLEDMGEIVIPRCGETEFVV